MAYQLSKRAQQFIRNGGKRTLPEIDPRFPPFLGVTPKEVPEAVFGPVDKLPDDYEACGDCGFDHAYEYEAAKKWHDANPGS